MKINVDLVYPIGSIYMNLNPTNPGTLFGGTWTQISGRFILGAGGGYSAGQTGGEASHTLNVNEMPLHSHGFDSGCASVVANQLTSGTSPVLFQQNTGGMGVTSISAVGGGQSHNNMPPYYVVYIWRRTA